MLAFPHLTDYVGKLLRIIGGSARGTKLCTFTGRDIRPTPDRVREALFSMLFSRLGTFEGKSVADLFAGTGALAMECLSRGAQHAWLVDPGEQSNRIIQTNLQACHFRERATLIRTDLPRGLSRLAEFGPFDLIFLDPPYGKELCPVVLKEIGRLELLSRSGLAVAETAATDPVPERIEQLQRSLTRRYGTTAIHFFAYPSNETENP